MSDGLRIVDLRLDVEATGCDIVDQVSISIAKGRVLALVGESGSGKTTVGLAVLGHTRRGVSINCGKVFCGETEILNLDEGDKRKVRGRLVSYVPQDPSSSLNPALRIGLQLREVLEAHNFGGSDEARKARIKEMMAEVLLPSDDEYLERYPHQLSGGQQQRVGLAMAFACRPSVIVLDEPTTGLDVTVQAEIMELLRQIRRDLNTSIILVSHDLPLINEVCDDIVIMHAGATIEKIPSAQIEDTRHPYTEALYNSRIDLVEPRGKLITIKGQPPTVGDWPTGCRFAARCDYAQAPCSVDTEFPLVPVGANHVSACIRHAEIWGK